MIKIIFCLHIVSKLTFVEEQRKHIESYSKRLMFFIYLNVFKNL